MGEQSTIWKNFIKNWKIYASPGKPSPDDISIVRKWLKKIKAKRVLLLGATPQLRDLLVELKCEAYTMDMQMDMLLGMQNYMKRKNPNEVIIKSDWLTSPLKDNYFDAILGDLILENIPYNQQPKLFSEIKRLLKKGAPWITKIFYPKDNLKDENPIDTINRIARMPYNINRYEELFIYFLFLTYNYKTKMCDVSKTEKMINYFYNNGELRKGIDLKAKKLFELMYHMWGKPMKKIWYTETRTEYMKRLKLYFTILDEDHARDYLFGEHFPTILCKPK